MVGEGEARGDSGVLAAEFFEELGAVALLAAVEEESVPEGRALGQKRLMNRLWRVGRKE